MKAQLSVLCLLVVCWGAEFQGVTEQGLFMQFLKGSNCIWAQLCPIDFQILYTNKILCLIAFDPYDQGLLKHN